MRPMCRHCGVKPANRPGVLCWRDYYTPGVKAFYLVTTGHGHRGVGNEPSSRDPAEPTDALPGTPEKLAVLAWRAANGFRLWHPADRRE